MDILQRAVVSRLPQYYRWQAGFTGSKVEPVPQNGVQTENNLVAIKLISPEGENAWPAMNKVGQALSGIDVDCSIIEYDDAPCLFVKQQDEFLAIGRLKNFGVAIAEPFLV
ncbi:YejG family protein [Enterobacteriaceae bacterium ESL0689]|nr:YejG family protein [Enterobacteriaceae bacterium ESL0689]